MKTIKFKHLEVAIALCALAANAVAGSPIFWVTNTNDDNGKGSLRTAITTANEASGGEIQFRITNTITLSSPLPSLTNITITGTNLLTISGSNQCPIFSMNAGTTNTLSGLTIADGMVSNTSTVSEDVYMCGVGISNAGSLMLLGAGQFLWGSAECGKSTCQRSLRRKVSKHIKASSPV